MISLNTDVDRARFTSRHHLRTFLESGDVLIVLSGVALVHFRGPNRRDTSEATQLEWHRDQLELVIDLDAVLPPARWLLVRQWVPLITLNAFTVQVPPDAGLAGGGWWHYPAVAVDSFWVDLPPTHTIAQLRLRGDIAVRYEASQLFRVGYHLTLLGIFVEPPPPPG